MPALDTAALVAALPDKVPHLWEVDDSGPWVALSTPNGTTELLDPPEARAVARALLLAADELER